MMLTQKIEKNYNDKYRVAYKYYSVLLLLNDIHLSNKEIELLSFIAVNGTISNVTARRDFQELYKTDSQATINNTVSKLKKMNLLIKRDNKIRIADKLKFDFSDGFLLKLKCNVGA